jgi:membrane protein implicated in regulation of membrane protease activity
VTGVTSALASPWGLFKHGWVVKKLLLTLANTVILLAVAGPGTAAGAPGWLLPLGLAVQLALFVLTTALSVYKPKGRIGVQRMRAEAMT